jgi:hypothetical protein
LDIGQYGKMAKLYGKKIMMTHECVYALDLDGSITCSVCGAMDDDMDNSIFETQVDFE